MKSKGFQKSYTQRKRDLKVHYARYVPHGRAFKNAVLRCYFRNSLTREDCAEVLKCDLRDIDWAIDVLRQEAQ